MLGFQAAVCEAVVVTDLPRAHRPSTSNLEDAQMGHLQPSKGSEGIYRPLADAVSSHLNDLISSFSTPLGSQFLERVFSC